MKTIVRWLVPCLFVVALATGCGEEEAPSTEAAESSESAPAEAAEGASGGTCEETATASDAECHTCCVARGAAGNAWMGGDSPTCRCIGG